MHDLATISRRNEQAHHKAILAERAAGRWVLVRFAGLHLLTHEAFATQQGARWAAARAPAQASERLELFAPLSAAERALFGGRDQSEDYAREVRP